MVGEVIFGCTFGSEDREEKPKRFGKKGQMSERAEVGSGDVSQVSIIRVLHQGMTTRAVPKPSLFRCLAWAENNGNDEGEDQRQEGRGESVK